MVTSAAPSFWLQLDPVIDPVRTKAIGSVTDCVSVIVHPFASTITTSYVPAHKFAAVPVVVNAGSFHW